jgi:hypothetical protein
MAPRPGGRRALVPPASKEALAELLEAKVQESLHLEYKDSRALLDAGRGEISKDVSSFANADGGTIIYGITERNHIPERIDDGISIREMSRERLEQIIGSNVAPRLDCVIKQIAVGPGRNVFAVSVPKSYRGPHQDRVTRKYYKRRNFSADPMEDYELADLRARTQSVPTLIRFDAEIRSTNLFFLVVENIGSAAARDVEFAIDKEIPWRRPDDCPPFLTNGIRHFAPRMRLDIFYGVGHEVLGANARMPAELVVSVKYTHASLGTTIREQHEINFGNYLGTWPATSPVVEQGRKIEAMLKSIADTTKRLESSVSQLASAVGPTGLEMSVRTMRNLRSVVAGDGELEKVDPVGASPDTFREVLGVGFELAYRLRNHFRSANGLKGILEIEGATAELVNDLSRFFHVVDDRG